MHSWSNFGFRYRPGPPGVYGATVSEAVAALMAASGVVAGSGGSLITPLFTPSRLSGAAPLGVQFDATATTAAAITLRPLHDLRYWWDFGDGTCGNLTYGLQAGTTRNRAIGFIAGHTYRAVGTYTPVLHVEARVGATWDTVSISPYTITVLDPNDVWLGAKTICVNPTGDSNFTGAPSGCVQVQNSDFGAAVAANMGSGDKRFLAKGGATYNGTTTVNVSHQGPGYFGKYGAGVRPIIQVNNASRAFDLGDSARPNAGDWRFVDLVADKLGSTSSSAFAFGSNISFHQCTWVNCEAKDAHVGWQAAPDTLNFPNTPTYTYRLWEDWFIDECTVNGSTGTWPGTGDGGNGMYLAGERLVIMNTRIDPNFLGEHGLRCSWLRYGAISDLEVVRVTRDKAHCSLRSPTQGFATGPSSVYGAVVWSEKNYVSNLKIVDTIRDYTGPTYPGIAVGCGPTNASLSGFSRDYVFENNWLDGQQATLSMTGENCTVRNNFLIVEQGTVLSVGGRELDPYAPDSQNADKVRFIGNSIWVVGTGTVALFGAVGITLPSCTMELRNNLVYGPTTTPTGDDEIYNVLAYTLAAPVGVVTISNNTVKAQINTNPYTATSKPTTVAGFMPPIGSYARGAGFTAISAQTDALGTQFPQTGRDMGALQH